MSSPLYASAADRAKGFARYAIALAKSPADLPSALGYATAQFGERDAATIVLKTAVAAGTTTDAAWAGPLVEYQTLASAFLELVRPQTVIGRLPLRSVPLNVRVFRETGTAVGYWVGEGAPAPLTSTTLGAVELPARKLVAQAVLTRETVSAPLSQAESVVSKIMVSAAAHRANAVFLSAAAEVSNVSPPGILSAAASIPATGDAVVDLSALIEAYAGSFESASFVMRPRTAVQLALLGARSASSTFIDLTAKGGQLFGLPCVTSTAVPEDSSGATIILLDAGAVLLGDGTVEIASSRHATLEMLDNPTNNSAMPIATTQVSMWASNSIAIKVQRALNWDASAASVVALTGADYSGA